MLALGLALAGCPNPSHLDGSGQTLSVPEPTLSISGIASEGEWLSAQGENLKAGYVWKWFRVRNLSRSGPVEIADASDSRYLLTNADVGFRIFARAVFASGQVNSNVLGPVVGIDDKIIDISFLNDDGSPFDTVKILQGKTFAESDEEVPRMLPRPQYIFAGWFSESEGGTLVDFEVATFNDDTELYARWIPPVTVSFYPENGSGKILVKVERGNSFAGAGVDLPQKPELAGNRFTGWFGKGGQLFNESLPFTEDAEFHARWVPSYTVTFYLANGLPVDPGFAVIKLQVERGETLPLADHPVNPHGGVYTFDGWSDLASGETEIDLLTHRFDKDTELYARWIAPVKITLVMKTGLPEDSGLEDRIYCLRWNTTFAASGVPKPQNPAFSLYRFLGWFDGPESTASLVDLEYFATKTDTVLYARWEAPVKVSFKLEGGSVGGDSADFVLEVEKGGSLGYRTPADPVKAGYAFSGWFTEAEGGGTEIANLAGRIFNADATLYAFWWELVTVSFDSQGGQPVSPVLLKKGRTFVQTGAEVPAADRDGFRFEGWLREAGNAGSQVNFGTEVFTANVTLYARWTAVFTITFDLGYGGLVETMQLALGETLGTNAPAEPSRNGYRFEGWFTEAAGGGSPITDLGNHSFMVNTVLYANWTRVYAITFNPANGQAADLRYLDAGKTLGGNVPADPVNAGFEFRGWFLGENGTGDRIADPGTESFADDTELFALWVKVFAVNFYPQNGEPVFRVSVDAGQPMAEEPVNPRHADKTLVFYGWTLVPLGPEDSGQGSYVRLDTMVFGQDTNLYAHWRNPEIGEEGPAGGMLFWFEEDGFEVTLADGSTQIFHYIEVATQAKPGTYPWQPRFTIAGTPTWIDVTGTVAGNVGAAAGDDRDVIIVGNKLTRINRILGYHNTELILRAFGESGRDDLEGSAAEVARNHYEPGFEHMRQGWFLPSMSDILALSASGIEFEAGSFWTSFQTDAWGHSMANVVNLKSPNESGDRQKDGSFLVRPVRVY
ncbi:MAG: InlB B-repeat-containing protein [Treponema sp.]|nr:InlB B-repeat-containing protein [Treponema sp.]